MSDQFPTPDMIPGLEQVAAALLKAQRILGQDNPFVVGICDQSGRTVASATLDSYLQLRKFSSEMEKLGFRALGMSRATDMDGCDLLFVGPALPPSSFP